MARCGLLRAHAQLPCLKPVNGSTEIPQLLFGGGCVMLLFLELSDGRELI